MVPQPELVYSEPVFLFELLEGLFGSGERLELENHPASEGVGGLAKVEVTVDGMAFDARDVLEHGEEELLRGLVGRWEFKEEVLAIVFP